MPTEITGLDEVVANLNEALKKIESGSLSGLVDAGIMVLDDTEMVIPLTPVDTGNLRNSRFLVSSDGITHFGESASFSNCASGTAGEMAMQHEEIMSSSREEAMASGGPTVVLGFSAPHATLIHEDMAKKFKRQGAGSKFLQASLGRNVGKILEIVSNKAKID